MRTHAGNTRQRPSALDTGVAIMQRTRCSPCDGVALQVTHENISQPSDWRICRDEHTVITHLGGPIAAIETEVNGVGARIAALGPGEVSIVPGGSRYAARAHGGVISYVTLEIGEHTLPEVAGASRPVELPLQLARRDTFASEAMRRLAELAVQTSQEREARKASGSASRDDLVESTMQALVRALCGHLLLSNAAGTRRETVRDDRSLTPAAVHRIERYVQERLGARLEVAELAHHVDVDVREFFRRFRAAFHTSPARYIVDQRVRRAKWLLTHTRHDITAIALQTGFATHSHLTTTFRHKTGLTPRAFRAAMRPR